jgi:hypothetical protein
MEEQPQQEGTTTRTLQDLPIRQSTDFAMVYANSADFATLPWDLTVIFGQVVSADPNNPYVEQRVAVTLSPQTAKMVLDFLRRNVVAYEQQYGEIRFAPSSEQPPEEPSA